MLQWRASDGDEGGAEAGDGSGHAQAPPVAAAAGAQASSCGSSHRPPQPASSPSSSSAGPQGSARAEISVAGSSGLVRPATLQGQPKSVSQSNSQLGKLRQKCQNSLHFSAVVLTNPLSSRVVNTLLHLCDPANQGFDLSRTECKTVKGLGFHDCRSTVGCSGTV